MQINDPASNENVNLVDQQDSFPLLSKLIRASALTAFKRDQTQLPIEKFKTFLHTKTYYHPFESEFKSLSWDDIVKILLDDQLNDHSHFDSTTRWFSIDSATVKLLITSSKLREPAEVFSDDLTMLRNISTMQLSAALRKNVRNLQQSIALANQVLHNYKEKKQANREKELQKQLQNQESEEQVEEKSGATVIDHDDNNVIETEPTMIDNNCNPVICDSVDSGDVDDSMHLLRKLICACAISAFPNIEKTELPLKTFQHYLLSNVVYHPFESEFKSLSWDDIVKILMDGKLNDHNNQSKASTPWFSINSSTVRLLIKLNIVKLKEPEQVYSDELTMLRNTSTMQLSAALRKNFSKIPKTLSMANQAFHKKKNKVEKRGEWKKNKLHSKNQNANNNFPNIDD